MANTILTPTAVTRKALMILHQKLNFIGTVNRQYDDSYAKSGAKIGSSLKIRLPNEFTVRTGKALNTQDVTEASETLTVSTQKGVDVNFSSAELTMDIDDFSERILDPAMSRLAAEIESDAMSMYKDVANEIDDVGAVITVDAVLDAARRLTECLAPSSNRILNLNPKDNRDLVDALTGLHNPAAQISKQYREGMVTDQFLGFQRVYENTLWPTHTTGTEAGKDTGYNVTAVSADGLTLTVDTGTGTFNKGDVIQIDGLNAVHPETKADLGYPKQFVVTATTAATATSIAISPALLSSGAKQTVSAAPAANAAVEKVESDDSTAVGNAADYRISMAYHKDAFAFATADLQMPDGVDFAKRDVMDGISLRIVRAYDINNDNFPCRIDVLYGYKTIRPQLACRLGFN